MSYSSHAVAVGYGAFRSGTSMLFANAVAPLGWRVEDDDDTMVRIVSSAGGATAGTNGMADAVGGAAAVSVDNYTLLEADIPAHTHTVGVKTHPAGLGTVGAGGQDTVATTFVSGSTGGGGGHAHTLSLDVKYVDMMRCTKL